MSAVHRPIVATRRISASPRELFDFLSDLERHWMLADRFVEVLTLDRPDGGGRAAGGTVRVRGPLGLSRTARTRVTEAHQDELISGTAEVGPRTRARVTWRFARQSDETLVELSAVVERAGLLDRIMLTLGGRVWMRRRFAGVLETLARRAR